MKFVFHELGEGVVPVGHRGKPGEAEHHLVEAGILWTRRGTREFVGGAGGNGLRFACEAEYLLCELKPCGLALAGEVERADEAGFCEDVAELARHGGRRGRVAVLVRHDFQHRARAVRQRHHRMDEARSAVPVEPGNAADHVVRTMRPNGFLARELALAVNRIAAGRPVEFVVRTVGIPIEDVVRGDGDQPHAMTVAGGRDVRGAERVQLVREFDLALALVDRGHRSAVDHGVGPIVRQKLVETRGVRDVGLGQIGDHDLAVLEFILDRAPEHAFSAGDEEFHCASSHGVMSANAGCFLSFSESRILSWGTRQSIPISGSLNRMPRSDDGM